MEARNIECREEKRNKHREVGEKKVNGKKEERTDG